jgi:hypothetical protein
MDRRFDREPRRLSGAAPAFARAGLRRVYIAKPDGRQRPLGIAALEDKIVQRAVVEVLNTIWEGDFLGFSYGFRPGRGPHDAPRDKPVGRRLTGRAGGRDHRAQR